MSVRTVLAGDTSFLLREEGAGDGTPVLLLHGVPETATCWRDVLPRLADGRRVLAPDLPGLGGSSYGGPYDVDALVEQVAALIEAETDGQVDLVGHDWGGILGLALAGFRPELVRRLVVANAPYRRAPAYRLLHAGLFAVPVVPELLFRLGGRRIVGFLIGAGWKAERRLDPEVCAEYEAAYSRPETVRAMLGYYRNVVRPRVSGFLPGRSLDTLPPVPQRHVLVLWGARDPALPLSTGEAVVEDVGPQCVMVTVPGAGHFVVEEAPDIVSEVLCDFLAKPVPDEEASAAPPEGPERPRVPEHEPPPPEQVGHVGLTPVEATPTERETADDSKESSTGRG